MVIIQCYINLQFCSVISLIFIPCSLTSISLSEDEQQCDTLSIKPPQPQADFSGEDKSRRHKKQTPTYLRNLSHHRSGRGNKSNVGKDGKKEVFKADGKEKYDSKYEDRHSKDSRKEDLRERLERDRKSRKSKDLEVTYESRYIDGKKPHDFRAARRNEQTFTSNEDDTEETKVDFKDHGYKEMSKKRKHQIEWNIITEISSPDDVQINKIGEKKMIKENTLTSKMLSGESTDEGSIKLFMLITQNYV